MPRSPAWPRAAVVFGFVLAVHAVHAHERPELPDLTGIVRDEGWTRILGKALFWDTVANVQGADCGSCHFVTGANRSIPGQSVPPLQLRSVAGGELAPASDDLPHSPGLAPVADRGSGIFDVCSRSVSVQPAELADSGPVRTITRVADRDPACRENRTVRFARRLLEQKPLEARSLNPDDGTFGPSGPHGNLISPTGRGLERTYQWMIEQAFEEPLWRPSGDGTVNAGDGPASMSGSPSRVEQNFQLFWGIAVMVYESTLDARWRQDHQLARSAAVPAVADGRATVE